MEAQQAVELSGMRNVGINYRVYFSSFNLI